MSARRAGRYRSRTVSDGHVILGAMTAVTMVAIERTGPAIRAALAAHAPEDEARFVAELRDALARAEQDLDLAGPQTVLRRWHARALMAANPLSADELAQLQRAGAGDLTGFVEHHDDGTTSTL
jgi:uncharacterized membrane protein